MTIQLCTGVMQTGQRAALSPHTWHTTKCPHGSSSPFEGRSPHTLHKPLGSALGGAVTVLAGPEAASFTPPPPPPPPGGLIRLELCRPSTLLPPPTPSGPPVDPLFEDQVPELAARV